MVIIRGITSIQHTIIIKLAIHIMLEKPTMAPSLIDDSLDG